MKIALFGGTGMVGSRIAAEAAGRGHEVTALSRSTGADMADAAAVRDAAATHDVVVSATGPSRTGEPHEPWLASVSTLIENAADARVLFVGGAGSLLTPDGTRLLDTDGFPEAYKAEATSGAAALDLFRAAPESLDWTFVSPAPVIAPGERTGSYTTSLDTPAGDFISAEDYAVALVDEIEQPQHRRRRFTAATV
ncbi:NAD(P)-dependent oxidoreductase [Nocardioides ganghwensis]|jgi:putative NADH-flavin reductase|uniref:NAD-dependent epimerase/dehydratase family protein n=1 Tax=Nocardioides ganghwensis TaxID=252230 RepID=A0A4Q2SHM1_9ACTN|nr:NAD(P)H-binding protein [Nocardioides ganghwensis]MBD3944643.1 NAD(P)H-binding protein [Nocardioides ganghwensis]RYC04391.1 NAD-dependent epimerase/dehydratase family protein [Nocardioides ganghwensis]